MDRRQFFINIARGTILLGLAAISTKLLLNDNEKNEKCNFDFVCKNCKKLKSCSLPEAEKYRENKNTN